MYDTVKLNIASHSHEKAITCLTNGREIKKTLTGEYSYSGKLENMDVRVFSNGITVNGSLGKFLNGNNIERLSRSGTKKAIEKLSDNLGLSFDQASIWRFDVGDCIFLERPVREYLGILG